MKKLMIAAAIVCAAALSQAASVTWDAGTFTDLPSCYGYKSDYGTGAGEDAGCIQGYVWESLTAFDYKTAEDVYNAYKEGKLDIANAKTGTSDYLDGALGITGADSYADGANVYAAILYLHNHEDDAGNITGPVDFYMANLAEGTASNVGGVVADLGNSFGGTGGAATVWTAAAVPEPTSGLLLLLGVAGLALRRRRA